MIFAWFLSVFKMLRISCSVEAYQHHEMQVNGEVIGDLLHTSSDEALFNDFTSGLSSAAADIVVYALRSTLHGDLSSDRCPPASSTLSHASRSSTRCRA